MEVHIKSCVVNSMSAHAFLLLQFIYMGFKFKLLILKRLPWPIADTVYPFGTWVLHLNFSTPCM